MKADLQPVNEIAHEQNGVLPASKNTDLTENVETLATATNTISSSGLSQITETSVSTESEEKTEVRK